MAELLETMKREQAPKDIDPYAGAGDHKLHEHDTRIFFFDRLLTLLGWELGVGGDVVEEARVKAGTTKFVDYVGVNGETRTPALILEAKAWDKPIVTGKDASVGQERPKLIVAAIEHLRNGGSKETAPVAGDWHDYLDQVGGYVRSFKDNYGHEVPSTVLSSGQWLLIFTNPIRTFWHGDIRASDFVLFELPEFVPQAHRIFEHIARVVLADTAPLRIYSAQLSNYVSPGNLKAAYHGVLIRYEKSGAPLIGTRPLILLYPALVVERVDQIFFTVIDADDGMQLRQTRLDDGEDALGPHIEDVAAAAQTLLQSCSAQLGIAITPGQIAEFPGFPEGSVMAAAGLGLGAPRKLYVRPVRGSFDEWIAVTGHLPHYLLANPVLACRFHSWAECRAEDQAIGDGAVGSPSVEAPRAFFVDARPHHCANRTLDLRREVRCHIRPIDGRTCCKACVYQDVCWSENEAATLPCGQ